MRIARITKYDAFGNIQKTYAIPRHANYWYEGRSIKAFNDVIYVAGYTSNEGMLGFLAKISDDKTIGIKKNENNTELNLFNVYPNPTDGLFQITCSVKEKCKLQVNVKDAKGQKVLSEIILQFIGDYEKNIDLSKQAKGIYFIEIIIDGKRTVRKIVVD